MARKPSRFLRYAFRLSVVVGVFIIPIGIVSAIESILDASPSCRVVDSHDFVSPDSARVLISEMRLCRVAFSDYPKATLNVRQNKEGSPGSEVFSGATENPITQIHWTDDSSIEVVLPDNIMIGHFEPTSGNVKVHLKWRDGVDVSWP